MLEKPDLQDIKIVACLHNEYGLSNVQITFLPLGADRNTAVYRAVSEDGTAYFVKLRRDDFDGVGVLLPKLLHDQGISQVIAPIANRSGQLWTDVDGFKLTLYLFVEGYSGFDAALTDQHWVEFGRALKAVHAAVLPAAVIGRIQEEIYSPAGATS